jgi:outer membrane protein
MRNQIIRVLATLAIAALLPGFSGVRLSAQTSSTRQLTVDDAVRLALEQNLGIKIERLSPEMQDFVVADKKSTWVPTISSTLSDNRTDTPATNAFSGGQTSILNKSLSLTVGLDQSLPTGARYALSWTNARSTSTNIFNSFNPEVDSNLLFTFTQPLLKNFKIDDARHEIEASKEDRQATDFQLQAAIVQTTNEVKNAYWDLTYQIGNQHAQQQSLDLARQLLADNERRVAAGTMASLDIVEAQSEVARNEEGVIVAEAAIRQAEDRLRVLILDPSAPDFWTVSLQPTDMSQLEARSIDLDAAVRRALEERTDVHLLKNAIAHDNLDIQYFHNQTLPALDARAQYASNAVGGAALAPITTFPFTGPILRGVQSQQAFTSVVGDVITNAFPTWSVGLTVAYPLGKSSSEANLARAKLQSSQADLQLKNLEVQVVSQVRDTARQVETNQKRIDSVKAARELAEQRLAAEQKKFAAGIETSFFVFQAQRDLSQARTDEERATADYNRSLADFDAIQLAPLGR